MGVGQVPVLATRLPVALFRGLLPCLEWRLFGRRLIRSGGRPWRLDAAWYATTGPNLRGCCWGAVRVLAVASTGTSLRFGQFRWGGAERCRDYIRTTVDCHCHRGVDLWKQVGHRTKSLASNAGERSGFALKSRVGFRHRPGVAQYHRSTKMHNEALGTRLVLLSEFGQFAKTLPGRFPATRLKTGYVQQSVCAFCCYGRSPASVSCPFRRQPNQVFPFGLIATTGLETVLTTRLLWRWIAAAMCM